MVDDATQADLVLWRVWLRCPCEHYKKSPSSSEEMCLQRHSMADASLEGKFDSGTVGMQAHVKGDGTFHADVIYSPNIDDTRVCEMSFAEHNSAGIASMTAAIARVALEAQAAASMIPTRTATARPTTTQSWSNMWWATAPTDTSRRASAGTATTATHPRKQTRGERSLGITVPATTALVAIVCEWRRRGCQRRRLHHESHRRGRPHRGLAATVRKQLRAQLSPP